MSSSSNSPHSVLFIPEILDRVFKLVKKEDLPRIARVCGVWSESALPLFWSDVNDLRPLFSILSPFFVADDNNGRKIYRFSRALSLTDWQRFDKYASFVRRLTYEPTLSKQIGCLSRDIITDIACSRPRVDIFYKMHTLVWNPPIHEDDPGGWQLSDAFLFMTPNVKSVIFSWGSSDGIFRTDFLQEIPRRMPNITHLELRRARPSASANRVNDELTQLCSNLLKLKRAIFPRIHLTDQIFEALSTLPSLQTIDASSTDLARGGIIAIPLKFTPVTARNGFPELITLASIASFSEFDALLNSVWTTPKLRNLRLYPRATTEPRESLHGLLHSISTKHGRIQSLILAPDQVPPSSIEGSDMPIDCINLDTLRPVLRMTSLRHLTIRYAHRTTLSALEIKHFLVSLPNLEHLSLNPAPTYLNESNLKLDVLSIIAHHCGRLRHLGLFFDASFPISPPPLGFTLMYEGPTTTLDPFPVLEQLSLGVSIVTAEVTNEVALHLSRLLPTTCRLETGVVWAFGAQRQTAPAKEIYKKVAQRNDIWKRVKELVSLFAQVRQEERDKVHVTVQKTNQFHE